MPILINWDCVLKKHDFDITPGSMVNVFFKFHHLVTFYDSFYVLERKRYP